MRMRNPFVLSLALVLAAVAPRSATAGHATCGAVKQDASGNFMTKNGQPVLMDPCPSAPATRLGNVAWFNCPADSFVDFIDGACYRCPKPLVRSAEPIWTDRACWRALAPKDFIPMKATFVQKANCVVGGNPFFDPKDNGCYSCPDGSHRTWDPIDKPTACSKGLLGPFYSAVKQGPQCPPNTFVDPRNGGECWQCPAGTNRTLSPVTADDACLKNDETAPAQKVASNPCSEPGAFFDMIDGGTCWSCPPGYIRTQSSVKSQTACQPNLLVWQPDKFPDPGLFGMLGMQGLALRIIREQPDAVTDAAKAYARALGMDEEQFVAATWDEIARAPGDSGVLKALVWMRLLDALSENGSPTQDDMNALKGFVDYYSQRRLYMATEMTQYQEIYKLTCDALQVGQMALINTGCEPIDANTLAEMVGRTVTPVATVVGSGLLFGNQTVYDEIFPKRKIRREMKERINEVKEGPTEKTPTPPNEPVNEPAKDPVDTVQDMMQRFARQDEPWQLVSRVDEDGTELVREPGSTEWKSGREANELYKRYNELQKLKQRSYDDAEIAEHFKGEGLPEADIERMLHPPVDSLMQQGESKALEDGLTDVGKVVNTALERTEAKVAEEVIEKAATKLGTEVAGLALRMLETAGPQIILAVAQEIAQIVGEKVMAAEEMRQRVLQRYEAAKQPATIAWMKEWVKSETGRNDVHDFYFMLVGAPSTPTLQPFAELARPHVPKDTVGKLTGLAGHCVVPVGAAASGVKVAMADCGSAPEFRYRIIDGTLHLASQPDLCLDVSGGHSQSGTDVQLWSCNHSHAQEWIVRTGASIRSQLAANRCLDVRGGNSSIGTPLQIWDCNDSGAQTWSLGASVQAASSWTPIPGKAANDVGIGPAVGKGAGALWIISNEPAPGGYRIYSWRSGAWSGVPGGANHIDVDPSGTPWVVNSDGAIFRWNGRDWEPKPGRAWDIGIGASGDVWIIGQNAAPGGFKVLRWNGKGWDDMHGGAVRIDVGPYGIAAVVNSSGDVFRFTRNRWARLGGIQATDVGVGADGSMFAVARDGSVYKWENAAWVKRDGKLQNITVDDRGVPFGASSDHQVFMGRP